MQLFCVRHFVGKLVPAPGFEGVAGSLVEVSLHSDAVSCVSIEIHDGVVVGHVLDIFKRECEHCSRHFRNYLSD